MVSRRSVLRMCGGLLCGVGVAGCLDWPGFHGGLIEASGYDRPPTNGETVGVDDDRIADVEPIQQTLDQIDEAGMASEQTVDRRGYSQVASALDTLPRYDRARDRSDTEEQAFPSGYYLEDDHLVYVVALTPLCGDSALIDARDGEHSWGDCTGWDPAENR